MTCCQIAEGIPGSWGEWTCQDSCGITYEIRTRECEPVDNNPDECPDPTCDESLEDKKLCDNDCCPRKFVCHLMLKHTFARVVYLRLYL